MTWYTWLIQLWAAPAAIGFAMLFNSPPGALWRVAVLAVLGHAVRDGCSALGSDIVMSTLLAALAVGISAQYWAARLRQATPVLAISAAIPMVPGVAMFNSLRSLLAMAREPSSHLATSYLTEAGASATRAILILFALVLGISAPWLLRPTPKSPKRAP